MIIVASLLAALIGVGIIFISIKELNSLNHDIDLLKTHSTLEDRLKIKGEVISLGINTDYPLSLLNWPTKDDYETTKDYEEAIKKARIEYADVMDRIEAFGNFKIEYRYTAPDGNSYFSRAVSRIPNNDDIYDVYKLEPGKTVTVYINKEDYTDSLLKNTDKEVFGSYQKQIKKPQKAKIAVGSVVAIMGLISPIIPWTYGM